MPEQLALDFNKIEVVDDIYFNGLGEPLPWEEDMATLEYIERKLQELRERWKKEVTNRPIIETQARLLQIAKEKRKV